MTTDTVLMKEVFSRPQYFVDQGHAWCAGCGYGVLPRIFNEEFARLGDRPIIGVVDIGCISQLPPMLDIEMTGSAHGRAISVGTGIKRVLPEAVVCVFIGDGGVLNEGLNEALHAAGKAENISVFMFNNGVLADTGGQYTFSATVGMPTSTSPEGRSVKKHGHPIKIAEILATMPGTAFSSRIATHDPIQVYRGQKSIRRALETQVAGEGLSFVDMLTICPTSWSMTPVEASKFQAETIVPANPVGVIKDWQEAGRTKS